MSRANGFLLSMGLQSWWFPSPPPPRPMKVGVVASQSKVWGRGGRWFCCWRWSRNVTKTGDGVDKGELGRNSTLLGSSTIAATVCGAGGVGGLLWVCNKASFAKNRNSLVNLNGTGLFCLACSVKIQTTVSEIKTLQTPIAIWNSMQVIKMGRSPPGGHWLRNSAWITA